MRAEEFTSTRVMAKIEKTGQIVQIMKHQDGDFLINANPDTKSHMGVKWIPDTTRFAWVRKFDSLKENAQRGRPPTWTKNLRLAKTLQKELITLANKINDRKATDIELNYYLSKIRDLEELGYKLGEGGILVVDQDNYYAPPAGTKISEVNYPDELSISDQIQQYFFKRGYDLAGEGRDQMAFESPRGTIVKVLGIGEDEREEVVRRYVRFFEQNQRNPFYPRIYNSGNFEVDGETYFVYEMERVNYVANEEVTLDYIEKLMSAVDREQGEQFLQQNPVPGEMSEAEIFGLIQATEDMIQVLGGQAPLDLTAVENLGRRDNGHLVIVDPYSL